jgi:hypothetical protein
MHKTFSGALDPGVKYRAPVIPQSAHIAALAEDDPKLQLYKTAADLVSHSALEFGKSINTSIFKECSKPSILSITNLMETMPQPKGKKKKKKKAKEEDDAAGEPAGDGGESPTSPKKKGKKKKKKKAKASDLPEPAKWEAFPAPEMSVPDQMSHATAWSALNKIEQKMSAANMTTATFGQRVNQFNLQYPEAQRSPFLPQSNFYGKTPDPEQDPFLRRKVKQLNDVDLIEDKEPEAICNI